MSARSIRARASNVDMMKRMRRLTELNSTKEDFNKNPPFMGEIICQSCGFKARYKFLRCPECNEVQK